MSKYEYPYDPGDHNKIIKGEKLKDVPLYVLDNEKFKGENFMEIVPKYKNKKISPRNCAIDIIQIKLLIEFDPINSYVRQIFLDDDEDVVIFNNTKNLRHMFRANKFTLGPKIHASELKIDNIEIANMMFDHNKRSMRFIKIDLILNNLLTIDQIKTILLTDGYFFNCLPDELKTTELLEIAIEKNGGILKYCPEEIITESIIDKAITKYPSVLEFIPKKFMTFDIILKAIEVYGPYIEYVPDDLITSDIFHVALTSEIYSIKYISKGIKEKFLTKEMITMILEENGVMLEYIPDSFIIDDNKDIFEIACDNTGFAFKYVPDKFKTYDLAKRSLEKNTLLEYIPENILDNDLLKLSVKNSSSESNLKYIIDHYPEKLSDEIISESLTHFGYTIRVLPKDKITKEFAQIAITKHGDSLQYIPEELIDRNLCEIALTHKSHWSVIHYVPSKYIDISLLKTCAEHTISSHSLIYCFENYGDTLIDLEFCKIAYMKNKKIFEHIPEKFKSHFEPKYVYIKTEYDCLILMDKIEDSAMYYQCPKKIEHVLSKEIYDEWIESNNAQQICVYCMDSIDTSTIYINKN